MVTKSKLRLALAAEKGIDFNKLKQQRKHKEALKRKMAQRDAKEEEEEEVDEVEDDEEDDDEDEDEDIENDGGVSSPTRRTRSLARMLTATGQPGRDR